MQHFKNLFSRHCYRHFLFWVLLFAAIYSAAGFLLAPVLIQQTIKEQVQSNLGWNTEIGKIELNPYSLALNIEQLSIIDQNNKEVIGFSRFYTNFTLRSIFELAVTFQSIELIDPRIDITINKEGENNLSKALAKHAVAPEKNEIEDEEEESSIIPLLIDKISLQNGALKLTNFQPSNSVVHQVTPISFDLENFSTKLNEDGQYKLDIALGTGQTINWNGLISVNPIHSSGSLDLSGIKVHELWPYLQDTVPYELTNAIASVKGDYEVSLLKDELALKIENSLIDIDSMKLTSENTPDGLLAIKKIHIGPSHFDLQEKNIVIKQVVIDTLLLDILRDQQGELAMLAPLANSKISESDTNTIQTDDAKDITVKDDASSQVTPPFMWSVEQVLVQNSHVNWLDKQPKKPAAIAVKQINIELNKLNQDLTSTLPFSINYFVDSSQKNTVVGDLVIAPLKLNSHLTLAGIDLTSIQPYVAESVHIKLEKGRLFTDADFQLSEADDGEIQGEFAGNINIKAFNSLDKVVNKRLLGWNELSINPIKIDLNPLAIDIGKIALTKPYFRVVIAKDRSVNLSKLSVEKATNKKEETPKTISSNETPLPLSISEVSLSEGSAYFADLSLQPQFGTAIEHMNGQISNLSSDNTKIANVEIKGTIDDYATMLVKGKLNPLSNDLYTDLNVKFDKIDLTAFTPYSGRHIGYIIDKGKLNVQLDYKIKDNKLEAKNRIVLDQFNLGDTVKSDEALDLPIKLALALFKNKDGVIDIDLPITGNLDDPEFKITAILLKTLGNLLTKAITSPFSAIANLAGSNTDNLNKIAFSLGSSELNLEQKEALKVLAEVLNKRPELVLEVRVNVDQKAEEKALKTYNLDQYFIESDVNINDSNELVDAMEALYASRESRQKLDQLEAQIKLNVETEQKEDEYKARYQQALTDALLETQPLESLDMLTLAKKRVSVIKQELIKVNKLPNSQVFVLNPSLDGIADKDKIITEFTLSAK
ncbi:DUF748 domain-containing protein [Vibrio sp. 2-Bac 85]